MCLKQYDKPQFFSSDDLPPSGLGDVRLVTDNGRSYYLQPKLDDITLLDISERGVAVGDIIPVRDASYTLAVRLETPFESTSQSDSNCVRKFSYSKAHTTTPHHEQQKRPFTHLPVSPSSLDLVLGCPSFLGEPSLFGR